MRASCLPGILGMIGLAMIIAYVLTALIYPHVDPSTIHFSSPAEKPEQTYQAQAPAWNEFMNAPKDEHNLSTGNLIFLGLGAIFVILSGGITALTKSKEEEVDQEPE